MTHPSITCVTRAAAGLAVAFATSAAMAQTPADVSLLTATNRPFPGTSPPFAPTSTGYSNSTVSSNGLGFALSGTGGSGISFVWGNPTAPTLSGADFYLFGTDLSPSASLLGGTALSTSGNVLNAASTGNRLFLNTTTIAETGTAVPTALTTAAGSGSAVYGDLLSAFAFAGERPVYRATLREGGATANTDHLLVRGLPGGLPEVLVQNSQLFPGAPAPTPSATGVGVTRRAYFPTSTSHSRIGDNWMTKIYLERGGDITSSNDQLMILNGAALTVGDNIVRLRDPIDSPNARPNEIWLGLSNTAVNGAGNWMFTGQGFMLGTANSQQGLLVVDGDIAFRETSVVSFAGNNYRLGANLGQAAMNENGDWAVTWHATIDGTTQRADVLLVNGQVIAAMGTTMYDLDGTSTVIGEFGTADGRLALTDRGPNGEVTAFFSAFLSPTSGNIGYFTASTIIPEPGMLSLAAFGLLALRRRR